MKNMSRRDAAKGLAAGVVGLSAGSAYAEPAEVVADRNEAKEVAFEFLKGYARFTCEECDKLHKAVMANRENEQEELFNKFVGPLFKSLLYCHLLPVYWQAIRLCFLLNVDGFKILQIREDQKKEMIELGARNLKTWHTSYKIQREIS